MMYKSGHGVQLEISLQFYINYTFLFRIYISFFNQNFIILVCI